MRLDLPEECWETKQAGTRLAVLTSPFDPKYPVPPPLDRRLTPGEFFRSCDCPPDFAEEAARLRSQNGTGGAPLPGAPRREELLAELEQRQESLERFAQWTREGSGAALVTGTRGCGKTVFLHRCAHAAMGGGGWQIVGADAPGDCVTFLRRTLRFQRSGLPEQALIASMIERMGRGLEAAGEDRAGNAPAPMTKNFQSFLSAAGRSGLRPYLDLPVRTLLRDLTERKTPFPDSGEALADGFGAALKDFLNGTQGGAVSLRCVTELFLLFMQWQTPRGGKTLVFDALDAEEDENAVCPWKTGTLVEELLGMWQDLSAAPGFAGRFRLLLCLRRETVDKLPELQAKSFALRLDVTGWSSLRRILPAKLRYLRRNSVVLQDRGQCRELLEDTGSEDRIEDLAPRLERLFAWDHRKLYFFLCRTAGRQSNGAMLRSCAYLRRNPNYDFHRSGFLYRSVVWHMVCDRLLVSEAFRHAVGSQTAPMPQDRAAGGLAVMLTLLLRRGPLPLEELMEQTRRLWPDFHRTAALRLLYYFSADRGDPESLRLFTLRSEDPFLRDRSLQGPEELERLLAREMSRGMVTVQAGPSGAAFLATVLPSYGFSACLCGYQRPVTLLLPDRLSAEDPEGLPLIHYIRGVRSEEQRLLQTAGALRDLDGGELYRALDETHTVYLDRVCELLARAAGDRPEPETLRRLALLLTAICRAGGREERAALLLDRVMAEFELSDPTAT